jgi:DNA-binding transcriptional MerR regulator
LEEIRELLGAWEQGVCAEVRRQLRTLVAARIAEAERRIAELSAFAAHLATVHEELGTITACLSSSMRYRTR